MDTFEILEQLNVSEECFNDIVSMVKTILSEGLNLRNAVERAEKRGKIDYDKYIKLAKKAQKIPSSNDVHQNEDGTFNLSNLSGKDMTRERSGKIDNDDRHAAMGRDMDEIEANRRENAGRLAIHKAIRRDIIKRKKHK